MPVPAEVRRLVRVRAGLRCEFCRIHEDDEHSNHQVEHVIPRQHGGSDHPDNLALTCIHCNKHKGPNLSGFDPQTGAMTPLFNPRQQPWAAHFQWAGQTIAGKAPEGRTTVLVLAMNELRRVELRSVAARGFSIE